MIKSSLVFTPSYSNIVVTCAPNGANVMARNGPNIPLYVTGPTPGWLTFPTLNGVGAGLALPQLYGAGNDIEQDLLVVNASDFQIHVAFGPPAPGPNVAPTGPTPPIGPGSAGCLTVLAQSEALLTANSTAAVAAYAHPNSNVITGALAFTASRAATASIYSTGTTGIVTFMRGVSTAQFTF